MNTPDLKVWKHTDFSEKHRPLLADILHRKENSSKYTILFQLQKQQRKKKTKTSGKRVTEIVFSLSLSPDHCFSWEWDCTTGTRDMDRAAALQVYGWHTGDWNNGVCRDFPHDPWRASSLRKSPEGQGQCSIAPGEKCSRNNPGSAVRHIQV